MTCPPGKIRRSAYTRANGVYVKSTCVPDKGLPGKTPASKKILPIPTPNALGKYGYHSVKKTVAPVRRAALLKGVKSEGYAPIIRRLVLISNYNKNSDPVAHAKMVSDVSWMQRELKPLYSKTAARSGLIKRSSKRGSKKGSKALTAARPVSIKRSSKRGSKKGSKKLIKGSTKMIAGRERQLYHFSGSKKRFYRYRKQDGSLGKRYV